MTNKNLKVYSVKNVVVIFSLKKRNKFIITIPANFFEIINAYEKANKILCLNENENAF